MEPGSLCQSSVLNKRTSAVTTAFLSMSARGRKNYVFFLHLWPSKGTLGNLPAEHPITALGTGWSLAGVHK